MLDAALAVAPVVERLDFGAEAEVVRGLQEEAVERVWSVIDMIHLVHLLQKTQTKDIYRSRALSVARLATYGQGHCHGLATVTAALLLPFESLLGVETRYRAGYIFKNGRDVDENMGPLKDGCVGTVEDHQWCDLTFVPSLESVVCDLSWNQPHVPIDEGYSLQGRRHPFPSAKVHFIKGYKKLPGR